MNYETSQKQKCTQQRENINARKSKIQSMMTNEQNDDCLKSTEMLQDRLMDLQNTIIQSQIVRHQLQTPKKHCDNTHDPYLIFGSDVSNTNSQVYDRISPLLSMSRSDISATSSKFCDRIGQQHSMSRSLPSSPLTGEIPNMTPSPTIPSNPERHFNFVPERIKFLEETRHLTESDEVDNGFRLYQGSCYSPQGKIATNYLLKLKCIIFAKSNYHRCIVDSISSDYRICYLKPSYTHSNMYRREFLSQNCFTIKIPPV